MKQAYQISKESDCKVALMILDKEDVLSQYSSDCMEAVLTKYLKHEYSSKRHFTNHNIEMAMNCPEAEGASEAASSPNGNSTGEHPSTSQTGEQASFVQTLRKHRESSSLTSDDAKAAELQRQQQQQQLEDAVNQLNNLKLSDKPNNANLMNSVVHKIAAMTDNPIEFWNRYLVYYGLLMHVYQLDQLSANPSQNPNDPVNPTNPANPNDTQADSARSTVAEQTSEDLAKEHPENENETEKVNDTEDAEGPVSSDDSSDDDFFFVDSEKLGV